MSFTSNELLFELQSLPIDFKKLDPNEFSWATFDSEHKVELTPDLAMMNWWKYKRKTK